MATEIDTSQGEVQKKDEEGKTGKGEKIKGDTGILGMPSGVFSRLFDLPSHAFCFLTAIVAFEIKDLKRGRYLHGGCLFGPLTSSSPALSFLPSHSLSVSIFCLALYRRCTSKSFVKSHAERVPLSSVTTSVLLSSR